MCYRCQRLGHTASNCSAPKARCLLCAKDHCFKDCSNPNELSCANCKGNHRANSRVCEYFNEAQRWEKEKTLRRNITTAPINNNRDNIIATMNHSQHFPDLRSKHENVISKRDTRQPIQSRHTYSSILNSRQPSTSRIFAYKPTKEISTQTDLDDLDIQDNSNKQKGHNNTNELTFTMETLATFLIRILDNKVIEAKGNNKVILVKNILTELKENNSTLFPEDEEIESSILRRWSNLR